MPIMPNMKERIQKVLSGAGIASRRNIEEMVRQGRVAVNGKIMIELPILIDPAKDKVTIDDELVRAQGRGIRRAGLCNHEQTSRGL